MSQPPVDPTVQRSKDRIRQEAQNKRAAQVHAMNAQRPAPKMTVEHTPSGTVTKQVHTVEAAKKNAQIDKNIETFKQRMRDNKGKAKDSFDRSR